MVNILPETNFYCLKRSQSFYWHLDQEGHQVFLQWEAQVQHSPPSSLQFPLKLNKNNHSKSRKIMFQKPTSTLTGSILEEVCFLEVWKWEIIALINSAPYLNYLHPLLRRSFADNLCFFGNFNLRIWRSVQQFQVLVQFSQGAGQLDRPFQAQFALRCVDWLDESLLNGGPLVGRSKEPYVILGLFAVSCLSDNLQF